MAAPSPMQDGGSTPLIIGRSQEIQWLHSLVDDVSDGHGRLAILEGEPGIGKTVMLDAVRAAAGRAGLYVSSCAAAEIEQAFPFSTLGNLLGLREKNADARTAELSRLITGTSTASAPRELAIGEAFMSLIDQWCAERPVALLIDDLHWADAGTLLALHRVGQAIVQQPLLLVVTRRPIPAADTLEKLLRAFGARGAATCHLDPLTQTHIAELIEALIGAPPDRPLIELAAAAGGNPLFATELVTALVKEEMIRVDTEAARLGSASIEWPASLFDAIARRLAYLSPATHDLLSTAAVLGEQFDATLLSRVMETPLPHLMTAVGEALRGGVLVGGDRELTFRHDMVRLALAERVPRTLRNEVHLRAARSLADTDAAVERVAKHLIAAAEPDKLMVTWLAYSADRLIARAPSAASDLLGRAWQATGDQCRQTRLSVQLARARLAAGQAAEAEQIARIALKTSEGTQQRARLYWIAAQACFRQGKFDAAIDEIDHAVALPDVDTDNAARLHGFAAQCHRYVGRLDSARSALDRAEQCGSKDHIAATFLLNVRAGVEFTDQNLDTALDLSTKAVVLLGEQEMPSDLHIAPHLTHGFNLVESDRFAEAEAVFGEGMRRDEHATGAFVPFFHMGRALAGLWSGRWDDSITEIKATFELDDRLGLSQGVHGVGAFIAVHRNGSLTLPELPGSDLEQAPSTSIGGDFFSFMRHWAVALAAEARGDQREALEILLHALDKGGVMTQPSRYWLGPDILRLADAAGETEPIQHVTNEIVALAARRHTPAVLATASMCRGVLENGHELVREAAEAFKACGKPLFEAHAREALAVALARKGDAEAREQLSAALSLYGTLGADHAQTRSLARLRHEGIRSGPSAPRRRAKAGWEAITDTEVRVAELVSQGLSNPEIAKRMFISRRTVQCHVSNILTKLSLRSRVELALEVSRRQPSPSA